jgi:hypothetical protein
MMAITNKFSSLHSPWGAVCFLCWLNSTKPQPAQQNSLRTVRGKADKDVMLPGYRGHELKSPDYSVVGILAEVQAKCQVLVPFVRARRILILGAAHAVRSNILA